METHHAVTWYPLCYAAAGCYDRASYHGLRSARKFWHEIAGTVVATGRGVTKWIPGDRVMSFHHIPCGQCFYCERRLFSQCKQYKTTGLTAASPPMAAALPNTSKPLPWVAERGIIALPDNVSFEEATFIEADQHNPESRSGRLAL